MSRSEPLRDRRGIAAVEFALTAPVLLVLLLVTSDVVFWLRTWLRMESTAAQTSQIISQYSSLYTSDFTRTFFPVAQSSAGDSTLACSTGSMVVTGVDNSSGTPSVGWQWLSGTCARSLYAPKTGSTYTLGLPGGYTPPRGFSAILVELSTTQPIYVFSSGIMGGAGLSSIGTYAVTVPRSGSLPTLTAGNRPP